MEHADTSVSGLQDGFKSSVQPKLKVDIDMHRLLAQTVT